MGALGPVSCNGLELSYAPKGRSLREVLAKTRKRGTALPRALMLPYSS